MTRYSDTAQRIAVSMIGALIFAAVTIGAAVPVLPVA
ncbi:hypothetical protein GGQ80_000015 [Sphingomonas jinjuensis]|uniref:Uncharacterized protein n=1 Tax=Sphingomonas jinjuensis TaxID=535907 RepID=A0A840F2U8_9SPHN|nr:hypothetical protein [Sphingomonas jinjuensis]